MFKNYADMLTHATELYTNLKKAEPSIDNKTLGNIIEKCSQSDYSERMGIVFQALKQPEQTGQVGYQTRNGFKGYKYTRLNALLEVLKEATKGTGIYPGTDVKTSPVHTDLPKGGQTSKTLVEVISYAESVLGYKTFGTKLHAVCESDPQDVGSTITYLRRYSLGSFFNIAIDTDDDGDSSKRQQNTQTAQQGRSNTYHSQSQASKPKTSGKASEKQISYLKNLLADRAKKDGKNEKEYEAFALKTAKVESMSELTPKMASELIDMVVGGRNKS